MTTRFDRWNRSGFTLDKLDRQSNPTGGKVWRGGPAGSDANLEISPGEFAPYRVDPTNANRLEYFNGALELAPTGQRLDIGGAQRATSTWVIEQETAPGVWTGLTKGLPNRLVSEEEFSDGTRTARLGKATARLEHPLSVGFTFEVHHNIGRGQMGSVAVLFTPDLAGTYRLRWRHQGIPRTGSDFEELWAKPFEDRDEQGRFWRDPQGVITRNPLEAFGPGTKQNRITGARFRDVKFVWDWAEAPLRDIEVTEPDANTYDVDIVMGPYVLGAQEELRIFPDSWGPTGIADTNNDCNQSEGATTVKLNGTFNNIIYLTDEYNGDDQYAGWRWLPDLNSGGSITSIDTDEGGTQIDTFNQADNSSPGTFTPTLAANDTGNTSVWSNTNRPSQITATAATVAVTGSAIDQTWNVQTIVEELVVTDGNTYDGTSGMSFTLDFATPSGGEYWSCTADLGTTDDAELNISYTPDAGGGVNPKGPLGMPMNRPLVGPMGA